MGLPGTPPTSSLALENPVSPDLHLAISSLVHRRQGYADALRISDAVLVYFTTWPRE